MGGGREGVVLASSRSEKQVVLVLLGWGVGRVLLLKSVLSLF